MLNALGLLFIAIGLTSILIALIIYKRENISYVRKELALIEGQGYADKHEAEKYKTSVYRDKTLKPVQRKNREISKEALKLLEEVESEAEEENLKHEEEKAKKTSHNSYGGTDVLADTLDAEVYVSRMTDNGTDILVEEKQNSGTDVLIETEGITIHEEDKKPLISENTNHAGTDVLIESDENEVGTDILEQDATFGTDVLIEQDEKEPDINTPHQDTRIGTDVLMEPDAEEKGTDILDQEAYSGTDILEDLPIGTDVLLEENKTGTDVLPDIAGTDVLK